MKHYFNFNWCLMLCLVCLAFNGRAQNIRVEAKLDTASIALGDQTNLHLTAHLPVNEQIVFPGLADTISSKIQIVSIGKMDTVADKNNPGSRIISRQYTITAFDAGLQMIPSFEFQSKKERFNTDALPLQVGSVTVDTTKSIYDIKQPLAVSYSFMDWVRDHWQWIVFSAAGILILIGLWYYYLMMRKSKPQVKVVKAALPPHVAALEKLQLLKDKKLWQQDQVKYYYSELTDIIREYLEKRYKVNAMEQTSEEIFFGLKSAGIPDQDMNLLRRVLTLADLVKFAKEKPLNTDNEQSIDEAVMFVNRTKEINQLPENKAQDNDEFV